MSIERQNKEASGINRPTPESARHSKMREELKVKGVSKKTIEQIIALFTRLEGRLEDSVKIRRDMESGLSSLKPQGVIHYPENDVIFLDKF